MLIYDENQKMNLSLKDISGDITSSSLLEPKGKK